MWTFLQHLELSLRKLYVSIPWRGASVIHFVENKYSTSQKLEMKNVPTNSCPWRSLLHVYSTYWRILSPARDISGYFTPARWFPTSNNSKFTVVSETITLRHLNCSNKVDHNISVSQLNYHIFSVVIWFKVVRLQILHSSFYLDAHFAISSLYQCYVFLIHC